MSEPVLMIVDGHAMAYRSYFAMINQNLTNNEGMPTGAIHGFFRMLLKLIEEKKPKYFVLVFDPPRKTFRSEIYPEYKANRKKTEEELKWQIDEIHEIAEKMGLAVRMPENEEADDLIASMVHKLQEKPVNIEIVSGDKDLYHLLNQKVHLLRSKKGVTDFQEIDGSAVREITGVPPEKIPDYMALTGDTSDNIPGVKGIGPKSAANLLNQFDNLDDIYANIDKVKPDSLRKKLIEHKDDAYLSLSLVRLKDDIPIEENLDSWEFHPDPESTAVLAHKGFETIAKQWHKMITGDSSPREEDDIGKERVLIQTPEALQDFLRRLKARGIAAIDTETTSLSAIDADLLGVSLAFREKEKVVSAYIPMIVNPEIPKHSDYDGLPTPELFERFSKFVKTNTIDWIGQNVKYDKIVLSQHGIELKQIIADTMIFSYLLNPGVRKHNLDDLAMEYLGHSNIEYKTLAGTGKKEKLLSEVPLEELCAYAAEDAEVTFRLYEILLPRVKKEHLFELYQKIDLPLLHVLSDMEIIGMKIDTSWLKKLERKFQQQLEKIETEIIEMAGEPFNIQSTKELQVILYDKLGLTSVKKTGTGKKSTDVHSLEAIKNEHPIIPKILEYRTISKLLSTYIIPLPESVSPKDGRIHTSFSQVTAATGRLASTNPNLQNIPVQGEAGEAIRKAFVAEEGYELLSLDYSQIELRLLAHYSQDPALLKAYENNEDIHDQAVFYLFYNRFDPDSGKWLEEGQAELFENEVPALDTAILKKMKKTKEFKEFRRKAKILNYSIIYGVTEFGLARNLDISQAEAKELIASYFKSYPGVKKYMDEMVEKARKQGYVENFFGRKRKIPEFQSKNRFQRMAAERLAMNTPLQSTAADIIKIAMIRIQPKLKKKKSRMILQVHDELIFEVHKSEKDEVYEFVKHEMEHVDDFAVPMEVNGGFGPNWADAK